jgi:tetratricopeptide (TPR) repeat protein
VRKVLFAAVVVGGVLGLLEVVLGWLGVRPAVAERDPYAGFAPTVPHFVVECGGDGIERVRVAEAKRDVLNPVVFEARKPPGTYRIVCLGGSTTYGRPFYEETSFSGWLRAFLGAIDRSRRWEVINAGAISYASYRVAGLLEELARFEPDLVVVYSGHNEFLERRTYEGILKTPGLVRGAAGLVSRTRIGGLIQSVMERVGLVGRGGPRALTARVGDEVRRIPINAVGPEAYHRDDRFRAEVLAHFGASLERIVKTARNFGTQVVLVTPVSNERDFEPLKSENRTDLSAAEREAWRSAYRLGLERLAAGDAEQAAAAFEAARALDGRHAGLLYRLARAKAAAGDREAARLWYAAARDEDIVPLRAVSEIVAMVRSFSGREGVEVIDFEAELRKDSEDGVLGKESFYDHVHITVDAHRKLAWRIVEELVDAGVVRPGADWERTVQAGVHEEVTGRVDRELMARELLMLSEAMEMLRQSTMAVACAERAVELVPEDGGAWRVLGWRAFRAERRVLAAEAFRSALDREPGDLGSREGLGVVLLGEGKPAEALECFERVLQVAPGAAGVQAWRGRALEALGRRGEAVEAYRVALALDPTHGEARAGLERLRLP